MAAEEALVIGAGPFGLSVSAHLRAMDVPHRIVGRPLDTWKAHMPAGMKLRSEPYGSDIAAPRGAFDLAAYCAQHGLDHVERLGPLSVERFLAYGDWFTRSWVPSVDDVRVTEVRAGDGGFRVSFDGGTTMTAPAVIVATGVLPFTVLPDQLSDLPRDLVTHTSDHHDLSVFRGRRVAIIGAGQSALETAALLHETGADPVLIARDERPNWLRPNPEHLSRLGHVRRPVNKLCEGWHCAFWNSPFAFRRLPENFRAHKARTVLGPAGAWWLEDRVEGLVEFLGSRSVVSAEPRDAGLRLHLDGAARSTLDVDHLICGTGFSVDIARLPFLPEELRRRVDSLDGYPRLTRSGQSTVPGLYFAGAPAALSLGPSVRFIAGTHTSVRHLARSVRTHLSAGPHAATVPAREVTATNG